MPFKVDVIYYFGTVYARSSRDYQDIHDDIDTSPSKTKIEVMSRSKVKIFQSLFQLYWGSFAPYILQIFPKSSQSSSVRHSFSSRTKIPGAAILLPLLSQGYRFLSVVGFYVVPNTQYGYFSLF